jgi:hypothetical protein
MTRLKNKQEMKALRHIVVVEPSPARWRTTYVLGPFRHHWWARIRAHLALGCHPEYGEVTVYSCKDLLAPKFVSRGSERIQIWPRSTV